MLCDAVTFDICGCEILVINMYSTIYTSYSIINLVLLQFQEDGVMPTSLHMTNTVFIDRAIIVQVKYFLSYSQIFLLSPPCSPS